MQNRECKIQKSRVLFLEFCIFQFAFFNLHLSAVLAAENLEQVIAGAKKEGDEIVFIAGAQTFGGRKGLSDLEAAFNKKFGTKARINFTPGPQMSSMAARLITEIKANRKPPTLRHRKRRWEAGAPAGIAPERWSEPAWLPPGCVSGRAHS